MTRPRVVLVAAVARNGVIGDGRRMPWHLPEDLAHFRRVTLGHPVLMGRRTWESLPARFRPLPGRANLVLSRDAGFAPEGARRCGSIDEAITAAAGAERLCVIGGAQVYAAAMPLADELVLTEIARDFEGEVRFPDWPRERYEAVSREPHAAAAPNEFGFSFCVYRRRDAQPNETIGLRDGSS